MKILLILLLALCLGLQSCEKSSFSILNDEQVRLPATNIAASWTQKADFPREGRFNSFSFTIGTKAYVGSTDASFNSPAFFEYDALNDTWTQKASPPGDRISERTGFSIGDFGYAGTGAQMKSDNSILPVTDFFRYDPVSNSWTTRASFPLPVRDATGFSIGSKGYIGTGGKIIDSSIDPRDGQTLLTANVTKEFYEYNPQTDCWTRKADFKGTPRHAAVGFSIGGKGYIGTGYYNAGFLKDFWEYNPALDVWTQKADFGGGIRGDAVGFNIGDRAYTGTGTEDIFIPLLTKDFWEYSPGDNTWLRKADLPGNVRTAAFGFSIGSKGFVGGGKTESDLWEFDPVK